jgi:hypothetical protein
MTMLAQQKRKVVSQGLSVSEENGSVHVFNRFLFPLMVQPKVVCSVCKEDTAGKPEYSLYAKVHKWGLTEHEFSPSVSAFPVGLLANLLMDAAQDCPTCQEQVNALICS